MSTPEQPASEAGEALEAVGRYEKFIGIVLEAVWSGSCEMQDEAEECGIIAPVDGGYDPEEHASDHADCLEPGDLFYMPVPATSPLPALRRAVEERDAWKAKFLSVGRSLEISTRNDDESRALIRTLRASLAAAEADNNRLLDAVTAWDETSRNNLASIKAAEARAGELEKLHVRLCPCSADARTAKAALAARVAALEEVIEAVRAQREIEAEHMHRWDNSQGVSEESYDEWKTRKRKVDALLSPAGEPETGEKL